MDNGFKSIIGCDDWYYTAKGSRDEAIVFKVAAWAVHNSGEVIGLISASNAKTDGGVARLVSPPPIGGHYVPKENLTEEQIACAKKG